MTPREGQYLYSTCNAADYGQIMRVGKDANGIDVIDILIRDPDDLIVQCEEDPDFPEFHGLTSIRLSDGATITLVDVQWRVMGDIIVCRTPGDGCFRCIECFWLHDEPTAR